MSRNPRYRNDNPEGVTSPTKPAAAKGESRPTDPKVAAWEEMLEAIGEGLICFTPDGQCAFASATACRFLSLSPDSLNLFSLCCLLPG